MIETLQDILNFSPPYLSSIKPSEWAEQNRVMSSDTSPFPGKFSYSTTPYWREIVDRLQPSDPARIVTIMKGAQIGASTGVLETGIGWIMSQNPGNILLTARDESLIKKMMDTKIDPMIKQCGITHLLRPHTIKKKNQRTGDTSTSKEFSGGTLTAMSIQTPERARQITCQYGFLDDFEAAKTSESAGSPSKLFETRFYATYDKMKLFYISTPETKQSSHIEPLYLEGDQRRYYVPCPCCGDFITIEWSIVNERGTKCGITWKLDGKGKVIKESVGYTCQSCEGFFTEKHKYDLLLNGEWRPTAEPQREGNFSYQISSLYSPPGMSTWEHYANDYVTCCPPTGKVNMAQYKTFVNTVLGQTWEERNKENDARGIALNNRDYDIGVIPKNKSLDDGNGRIVLITCSADMGGYNDDARLDYEVVAWAENGSNYSIKHGSIGTFERFKGKEGQEAQRERLTYDLVSPNSVWPLFEEVISKVYDCDDGTQIGIQATALDSSAFTSFAYNYCKWTKCAVFPIKGLPEKANRFADGAKVYQKGKETDNLYILNVNKIKDFVSEMMDLNWGGFGVDQPPGFMNFPNSDGVNYTFQNYFKHYEAEQRYSDPKKGTVWLKKHSAVENHFFDCRVYNYAIREIFSAIVCESIGERDGSFDKYVNIVFGS
jgi:phage terminase large subunit GpA-like protein